MEEVECIRFRGCNFFRQRLILSCFSKTKIIIGDLKESLKDYEKAFLNLLETITNGSIIRINDTGRIVSFSPGILNGTEYQIDFRCPPSRGIGYFLEPLVMLAPFCKYPINIKLRGITNNTIDPSFDMINFSLLPVLKKFLIVDEGIELKLHQRGLPPNGEGIVVFKCPVRKSLKAFQWEEIGKVKRIRGTVFTCNVAPNIANRVVESAKEIFNKVLIDVYFTNDSTYKKNGCPGYGLCSVAETHKGSHISAEYLHCNGIQDGNVVPEDVGKLAANALFEEIYKCGVVDSLAQSLVLLFMVLGPKDVSKAVFGPLSPYTMNFLKLINEFFNIKFQIEAYKDKMEIEDKDKEYKTGAPKLLLTCLGIGYTNVNKPQI